jgi:hypothetical protein
MFKYQTSMDYAKNYERSNVHTTIREDYYQKFLILSVLHKQRASKMFDVLLMELFNDKDKIDEFIQKVKSYH